MLRGLQTSFGGLVGAELLVELNGAGVESGRIDCHPRDAAGVRQALSPEDTLALVQEHTANGLHHLATVLGPESIGLLPPGSHVEVRNEPDLEGPDPATYAGIVRAVWDVAEPLGLHVWAGAVSNLNDRGLDYLQRLRPYLPSGVGISVHRYPHDSWLPPMTGPTVPHEGFDSREAEVDALRGIIGTRRWRVSEFGYHNAPRNGRLFHWPAWTHQESAEYIAWEWAFWEAQGAEAADLFQINDGPEGSANTAENRFGVRYEQDGVWRWKPALATFARGA
jgi:hypothetical protein